MTPEAKVKKEIDAYLDSIGAFYRKPVVTGYGPRLVDYIGCYKGRFFAIEAKKPKDELTGRPAGKPTAQQAIFLRDVYKAGGIAIVASCIEDVDYAIQHAINGDCPWIDHTLEAWIDDE